MLLLLWALCPCCLIAQTDSSYIETKEAIHNSYYILHKPSEIILSNTEIPFEGKMNQYDWKNWYTIDWHNVKDLSKYVRPYLEPYVRNMAFTQKDWFWAVVWFDLHGKLEFVRFHYPSSLNVPITVIEQIEAVLKTKEIPVRERVPGKTPAELYAIQSDVFVNLKDLQTEITKRPPVWGTDDFALSLGWVAPKIYDIDNYLSPKDFYPYMFNFTDGSTSTEGNYYLAGQGEASFSFELINQQNYDWKIDLKKLSVKLEPLDGSSAFYPIITSIDFENDRYYMTEGIKYTPRLISGQSTNEFIFNFEDILQGNTASTTGTDYRLSILYDDQPISLYVDQRYPTGWAPSPFYMTATWYRKPYIIFRYAYVRNNSSRNMGRYYNKTTGWYSD